MPYLLIESFYIGIPVVRTDGRSGGRAVGARSRDYQIFSDGQITSFSYSWCSAGALRARELHNYTLYSLSVFSLTKSLQLILEISATKGLVVRAMFFSRQEHCQTVFDFNDVKYMK